MGNTYYLNGLDELNCCLENSNNPTIPVQGLGEAFSIANSIKKLAAQNQNTVPAKQALTKEITKAADKIIGKTPVTPMVNPSLVNVNKPKPAVVNTAVTAFKQSVIEQKQSCKANCAPPVRTMPGVIVKVDPQTGKSNKKQLRKFNAQELNTMTRVVIEPMRKSLEATLQNLNQYPAENAVYYNVPVYKAFITEMLQNWSNPAALKQIVAKYRGKVMNKPVINQMAMVAGLTGRYNGLNGLGDFLGDVVDAAGDAISNAAKAVSNFTSNVYDSLKAGVDVTFDLVNRAGAAIGEGIKNAAIWTVGMLQKYNPVMILARQAFRGLLAINFRGWASDMQGMRDRGEENKIKDAWTGTFVGGNWGDLVSAINTGAGRDKNKATEQSTTELTAETIDTIEPFDWVSGQKDGLGFHTVAKHTLKADDEISINVLIGDKSYNGVYKVKYIGDDEGKQKDNFFVLNIIKKGGASGTFQFADEFARTNDLWKAGIDPDSVNKNKDIFKDVPKDIVTVPVNQIPDITKLNTPSTEYTISVVDGRVVRTPIVKNAPTPVVTTPIIKPVVTTPVTAPVTTKVVGKSTIKFNIAPPTQSKQGVMKGLGALITDNYPYIYTGNNIIVTSKADGKTPIILVKKGQEILGQISTIKTANGDQQGLIFNQTFLPASQLTLNVNKVPAKQYRYVGRTITVTSRADGKTPITVVKNNQVITGKLLPYKTNFGTEYGLAFNEQLLRINDLVELGSNTANIAEKKEYRYIGQTIKTFGKDGRIPIVLVANGQPIIGSIKLIKTANGDRMGLIYGETFIPENLLVKVGAVTLVNKNAFVNINKSPLGSLGAEPVTTATILAAATPVITVVTAVITGKAPENTGNKELDSAAAEFNRLKKIKEDAERALQQGKDFVNQFKPSDGGGSNNNGSTPSTPQPNFPIVGPGGTNPNNANPDTPATPNGGNNNANNGGGNSKILLIGGAIAAVVLFAIMSSNSNAKPTPNLNGLPAKKATKTLSNFKL